MLIQVHGSEKPAIAHRALVAAALLLMATGLLAAMMTRSRIGGSLGPAIRPVGWGVSFRAPARFQPRDPVLTSLGTVYPFLGFTTEGRMAILAVRRLANEDGHTASELCIAVLREHRPFARSLLETAFAQVDTIVAEQLGPLPGAEILDSSRTTVVRAAVTPQGEGYAVSLSVDGGRIDPRLYGLFEAVCDSVEPEPL